MKTLIIGNGEVGKALYNILKPFYKTYIRDTKDLVINDVEILHICFPVFKTFVSDVKKYVKQYNPKFTVIHSSTPVGVTRQCKAYHSPIRGIHPHLEEGIKTFVKYISPPNDDLKKYFEKAGMTVKLVDKPENTEAMKMCSTTQYGMNIIIEKEIYEFCQKNNLDYDFVYKESNRSYNEGYDKLGHPEFRKYELTHMKGGIGGHCILENARLLKMSITKYLLKQNEKFK